MTVSKKLYSGTSTAVIATLLLGGTSWYAMEKMGSTIDALVNRNVKKVALAGEINTVASDIIAAERAVLFAGSRHDSTNLNRANEDFKVSTDRLAKATQTFLPLIETEEGRRTIKEIQSAQGEMATNHKSLVALAPGADSEAAIKFFDEKVLPLVKRINNRDEGISFLQNNMMA